MYDRLRTSYFVESENPLTGEKAISEGFEQRVSANALLKAKIENEHPIRCRIISQTIREKGGEWSESKEEPKKA